MSELSTPTAIEQLEILEPDRSLQNDVSVTISGSSIENMSVTGDVTIVCSTTNSQLLSKDSPRKSINNIRQPPEEFIECKAFIDIKEKIGSRSTVVMHLHGFPCSGKSTIVRKLAKEFPSQENENVFVKHFIECSDGNEDIQSSFKALLQQMRECNLVRSKAACENASDQLEKKRTAEFVEVLAEAAVPIFIAIEDPSETDNFLLCDLVRSIKPKEFNHKLHVFITSQSKSICDFCKEKVEIKGLTKEESLKLLNISLQDSEAEMTKAALKVIGDLHGSPLGLMVVREYCHDSRINYTEYIELLDTSNHKDDVHLKKQQERQQQDLYRSVVTLLKGDQNLWNTIKILSFFHHGSIPQRLIGSIKQAQHGVNKQNITKTYLENKQRSGQFISRLEDFSFCEVKGTGYEDTKITLHQVIFKAVQAYMENGDFMRALQHAVFALSSVVHKDLRKEVYEAFMRSMIPHLQSVLDFVHLNPKLLDDFVTSMAVSHLQEVCGCCVVFVNKVLAEECFRKSAQAVWDEMCKRSGMKMDFRSFVNQQSECAENVAKPIVKACVKAGGDLQNDKDYLNEYITLVTQFKDDELDNLTNVSKGSTEVLQLKEKKSVKITTEFLRKLRTSGEPGMFLEEKIHYKVFFVDRLASIMYSLGRLALHDKKITSEKRSELTWMLDMAHALCQQCRQQTGVKLLFLRLSAISRVYVRLANRSAMQDVAEKCDGLIDALKMAENNLDDANNQTSDAFYENGLKKCMRGNTFDRMTNYRSLIRICTRLLSQCTFKCDTVALKHKSDRYYKECYALAKENIDNWRLAAKCLVYCGKYMASLGNYAKAIEHFQEALLCKVIVDEKKVFFPWVCYNYARATVAGKLDAHKQDAIDKCSEALKNEESIISNLSGKLLVEMEKLTILSS